MPSENSYFEEYWNQYCAVESVSGCKKFPNVVVKAALAMSHGSASVERGFSTSGLVLTNDKRLMNSRLNIITDMKSMKIRFHYYLLQKSSLFWPEIPIGVIKMI